VTVGEKGNAVYDGVVVGDGKSSSNEAYQTASFRFAKLLIECEAVSSISFLDKYVNARIYQIADDKRVKRSSG
jgi:hypothetical protein